MVRQNLPAGAINYSTHASTVVGDAPLLTGITVPTSALVRGTNVLAVEVHQAVASDPGMVFGAGLNAVITPRPPVERPTLIGRNAAWKFDASNTDLGTAWRADTYNDQTWSVNAAIFFSGSGAVDGIGPERLTNVAVSASSELTSNNRLAIDAVNGAGLIGNAHVNTPDGMMWLSRGTFAVPNDLSPQITFDLGAMVPVRYLKV